MEFHEVQKLRTGWATAPIGLLFDDCKIDQIQITIGMIDRGVLIKDDIVGVSQYRKRSQSIILPSPKGQKISAHQQYFLDSISNNQSAFEKGCKLFLVNSRKSSISLLPTELEIEKCVELMFIIIPFELDQGIRLYFTCDWGDCASGGCVIALQFFDFSRIEECDFNMEKYGL